MRFDEGVLLAAAVISSPEPFVGVFGRFAGPVKPVAGGLFPHFDFPVGEAHQWGVPAIIRVGFTYRHRAVAVPRLPADGRHNVGLVEVPFLVQGEEQHTVWMLPTYLTAAELEVMGAGVDLAALEVSLGWEVLCRSAVINYELFSTLTRVVFGAMGISQRDGDAMAESF